MSFFANNATISGQGQFETAEAGAYLCKCVGIDVKEQPSFDNPEVMEKKFQWKFETIDASDSNGNPFRFSKFTSVKFGNDRSGLTILLDSMFGRRLTAEEFQSLDIEDIKSKNWKVMVDEKVKDNGYTANTVLSVKPSQRPQQPQGGQSLGNLAGAQNRPVQRPRIQDVDIEGLEDPFAENDGKTTAQQGHVRRTAA